MKTCVNIQEKIGKTVGRRSGVRSPLCVESNGKNDRVHWKRVFGGPFIPRGVYRFKTQVEADAWTMKMLTTVRPS